MCALSSAACWFNHHQRASGACGNDDYELNDLRPSLSQHLLSDSHK